MGQTLVLATGSTPIGVYQELIRMHRDENLEFYAAEAVVTTYEMK